MLIKKSQQWAMIAIQAGVQKDKSSCYTFSYALSKILSKTSFDELSGKRSIAPPEKFEGKIFPPKLANSIEVHWKDITALGKKAVMLNQSLALMEPQLKTIYNDYTVNAIIENAKKCYANDRLPHLDETVFFQESYGKQSYIQTKRSSLADKAAGKRFEGLSVKFICEKMKTDSPEQALRRLASGKYDSPKNNLVWTKYLLSIEPDLIKKASAEPKAKPPLHWAYESKQIRIIDRLRKCGADPDAKTYQGRSARESNPHLKY